MFLPAIGSAGLWDSSPIQIWQTTLWSCFSMQVKQELGLSSVEWGIEQLQDLYAHCHVPTVVEDYRKQHTPHELECVCHVSSQLKRVYSAP